MGEQHSVDGRTERRRAHRGDPETLARVEALLAAALRVELVPDSEAEQRAVRAFRAARARLRDDRHPRRRRGARSLRTALPVLLAGFTLGGVAFAAIGGTGSASRGTDDEGRAATPSASRSAQESADAGALREPTDPASPSASAGSDRRDPAREAETSCRAYEQASGRGAKPEPDVWKRLVAAAGGERKVDGYCERTLGETGAAPRESGTPDAPDGLPTAPVTTPGVPSVPTTRGPVDPTVAVPTAPTALDLGRVTDDVVKPGLPSHLP